MATLAQLQEQIVKLQREAEQIRKTEVADAIARVREVIAQYDLTPEDLFGRARAGTKTKATRKALTAKAPKPPKYRDPKSGKTWSGMGKPPNWIAGVRNRDKFLIDAAADTAQAESSPESSSNGRKSRRSPTKASRKATSKASARRRRTPVPEAAAEAGTGPEGEA